LVPADAAAGEGGHGSIKERGPDVDNVPVLGVVVLVEECGVFVQVKAL
jgi:hypothetical protein